AGLRSGQNRGCQRHCTTPSGGIDPDSEHPRLRTRASLEPVNTRFTAIHASWTTPSAAGASTYSRAILRNPESKRPTSSRNALSFLDLRACRSLGRCFTSPACSWPPVRPTAAKHAGRGSAPFLAHSGDVLDQRGELARAQL